MVFKKKRVSRRMKNCLACVSDQRGRGSPIRFATEACGNVCKRNIFDSRDYEDEEEDEKFNYPSGIFGF